METCASFFGNPSSRCPNPRRSGEETSVFCEIHSRQHLLNYLKYKKQEAQLTPIKPGQSANYYLQNYARFSNAHELRFNFREQAITYSARDIGHQIRLDWLWLQMTLCIKYLEKIFASAQEPPSLRKTPSQEFTPKEKAESRRVFNVYKKTKKRVDDYDEAIKEALRANEEMVDTTVNEYINNIHLLLGPDRVNTDLLMVLGKLLNIYGDVCDPKIKYSEQLQVVATPYIPTDEARLLKYTKIGYNAITSIYQDHIPARHEDSPVLADNPDKLEEQHRYINNVDLMLTISHEIARHGMVVYFSSKILRALYTYDMCYLIANGRLFLVGMDTKLKQLTPYSRYVTGMVFTEEQLSHFDINRFIEEKGQLDQLLVWYGENLRNDPLEKVEIDLEYRNALLVTEYYTQALIRVILREFKYEQVEEYAELLGRIAEQLDTLTKIFPFTDIVYVYQQFRSSGILRRKGLDSGIISVIKRK